MNQVDSVINYADSISLSVNNMSISSSKESEKKDSEAHYMTIEELADYIGMSVRNIRAYNSAGMLPPITLRGRLGLYGTEHTARLEVIRSLREQGFGLERIKQILQNESRMPAHADAWMAAQSHILNVIGQSSSNSETVQTEVIEQDWDQQLTPEVAQKLQQSGILRIHEDGSMEHLAPGLRPLGNRLASMGVTIDQGATIQNELVQDLRRLVRTYLRLAMQLTTQNHGEHAVLPGHLDDWLRDTPELLLEAIRALLPILLRQEADSMASMMQRGLESQGKPATSR